MSVRSFLERLFNRESDRLSQSPADKPHQGADRFKPDRLRKVRGKVALEGRLVADGVAELSVSEDHSWSATWTSPEPWPDLTQSEGTVMNSPSCAVRFEGITPILTGVASTQGSADGGEFGLKVVGQSWPSTDFD